MTIKKKRVLELPEQLTLPAMAVRDMVVFPHMMAPLFMGRAKSIRAAELAASADTPLVLLLTQINPKVDDPAEADLYKTGTVATITQLLRLPDGTVKALVEGRMRYRVTRIFTKDDSLFADCERIETTMSRPDEAESYRRALVEAWGRLMQGDKNAADMRRVVEEETNPERVLELICAQANFSTSEKSAVLSEPDLIAAIDMVLGYIERELEVKNIQQRIDGRVKRQMEKNQRDYYLHEQIKALRKELGDTGDGEAENDEFREIEDRIVAAKMPKDAEKVARDELRRLRQMPPMSSEAVVTRSYIDTLLELPWAKKSRISRDLTHAAKVLDEAHSGLEKVKERILEYLAVQKRVGKVKSPILCFVGAPGVGKTSLGESIARATGRQYVRIALGGVHDESEIRGHRRTYVGSMPGQIIKGMIRAGVKNPLFLLDEIDKMSSDYRGDPASAMLEVLDPEQNDSFSDHYVELPFDLSDVMFVATSNSDRIPPALMDRMEVISLSGYTEEEKLHIARHHLIPKQFRATGLRDEEVEITDAAVLDIVRYWTREAGVRSLERAIGKICRKIVFALSKSGAKKTEKVVVTPEKVHDYLGPVLCSIGMASKEPCVGRMNGLAWTSAGGDLLPVEALVFPGKGAVQRTGSLGDVMKESIEAARSVVRTRARELGIKDESFHSTDIHVHYPEAAVPKDGPSAGAVTAAVIISAMTGIPIRQDVAMTGEITLHGEIKQIGGLKEKILAAIRGGCTKVLIPSENVGDLEELPESARSAVKIVPVKTIDDVIPEVFVRQPQPLSAEGAEPVPSCEAPAPVKTKRTRRATAVASN